VVDVGADAIQGDAPGYVGVEFWEGRERVDEACDQYEGADPPGRGE
jgi:hypothetical protein